VLVVPADWEVEAGRWLKPGVPGQPEQQLPDALKTNKQTNKQNLHNILGSLRSRYLEFVSRDGHHFGST
jgi:hypothetical protein